jgi:hypothetical protein
MVCTGVIFANVIRRANDLSRFGNRRSGAAGGKEPRDRHNPERVEEKKTANRERLQAVPPGLFNNA